MDAADRHLTKESQITGYTQVTQTLHHEFSNREVSKKANIITQEIFPLGHQIPTRLTGETESPLFLPKIKTIKQTV